jgi:hypothetical protein
MKLFLSMWELEGTLVKKEVDNPEGKERLFSCIAGVKKKGGKGMGRGTLFNNLIGICGHG